MKHKIICIGRQVGSGGKEIGEKLSERLNIPCYDRKLIEIAAQRTGMDEEILAAVSETKTDPLLYANLFQATQNAIDHLPPSAIAFMVQREIILEVAKEEDCIIIGRCADAILKEVADVDLYRIFVAAPTEKRANRLMQLHNFTEKEANTYIKKRDRSRKSYYDFHTERKWGNPANYDICINSAKFGIDGSVDFIAKYFE